MSTFTWLPDVGFSISHEPRIREAKFGDGYSQRTQDGLNADMAVCSPSFSARSSTEALAIDAFLIAAGGVTAFDWTPPGGSSSKWICKKWSRTYDSYEAQKVTAEFRQVPA